MSGEQKIVVDQLVDIIQTIQIGRKTGTLTATRGEEASYEVGIIIFDSGKVIQAKAGRRKNREALNWLSTWGMCQCAFVLSIPSDDTTYHKAPQFSSPEHSPRTIHTDTQHISSNGQIEPIDARKTGPLTPLVLQDQRIPHLTKPLNRALHLIEQNGLSRTHRHLLLLIDGTRSIAEISRIFKRDDYEILTLLRDLQDITVITVSLRP
jgi:hypothetical protein